MLAAEEVDGHISWTRSDSDLAFGQRMERGMGLLFREKVRNGIRIDGSVENPGPNPIPREFALTWSCPEALELWSNWEHLALVNWVLYKRWDPGKKWSRDLASSSTGEHAKRNIVSVA